VWLKTLKNSDANERDLPLDGLKGLAIVGVLFAHMSFTSRFSDNALFWLSVAKNIFGWCVLAFFFCAGKLTHFDGNDSNDLLFFIKKRAKRLLIPCLTFSLTYKICLILIKHVADLGQPIPLPGRNIFKWCDFVFFPAGPQFYFLPYLFIISLVSALAFALIKQFAILSWVVLISVALFYAVYPAPLLPFGQSWVLIPGYVLSFWLGLISTQDWRQHRFWWWALICGICILCIIQNRFTYVYFILPAMLYSLLRKITPLSVLLYLGRKSGCIYVWHDPILLPACSILAAALLPNEILQVIVIMVSGIGISILLGGLVNRCGYLSFYRF
jgi:fucose 4-O-acetylase-like acetyltransferase